MRNMYCLDCDKEMITRGTTKEINLSNGPLALEVFYCDFCGKEVGILS